MFDKDKYLNVEKPRLKYCEWCKFKNSSICEVNGYGFDKRYLKINKRQWLKFKKQNSENNPCFTFRYCKKYRFSKLMFKSWKKMQLFWMNQFKIIKEYKQRRIINNTLKS